MTYLDQNVHQWLPAKNFQIEKKEIETNIN